MMRCLIVLRRIIIVLLFVISRVRRHLIISVMFIRLNILLIINIGIVGNAIGVVINTRSINILSILINIILSYPYV